MNEGRFKNEHYSNNGFIKKRINKNKKYKYFAMIVNCRHICNSLNFLICTMNKFGLNIAIIKFYLHISMTI